MLHRPITFLRESAGSDPVADLAALELVQRMFGLDEDLDAGKPRTPEQGMPR